MVFDEIVFVCCAWCGWLSQTVFLSRSLPHPRYAACAYFLQAALHNHNPFTYSALNDIVNDAEIMQYTVSVVNILAVANTNGYGSYGSGVPTVRCLWLSWCDVLLCNPLAALSPLLVVAIVCFAINFLQVRVCLQQVPSELNVLTANMLFGAALWAGIHPPVDVPVVMMLVHSIRGLCQWTRSHHRHVHCLSAESGQERSGVCPENHEPQPLHGKITQKIDENPICCEIEFVGSRFYAMQRQKNLPARMRARVRDYFRKRYGFA